ncbi:hypothetical protein ACWEOE_09920 [Amycolatopsis sp. NPDC004368]
MNPHDFTEQFVLARQSELRASAAHRRLARSAAPPPSQTTPSARERLGWLLVHAGLRLATSRGEHPRITLPA